MSSHRSLPAQDRAAVALATTAAQALSDLGTLSADVCGLREENARQQVEIGEKVQEIHRLWDLLTEAGASSEQLLALNQASRRRIEELESELRASRDVQARLAQAEWRLGQVEGSRSWALTAPLRGFARQTRSLRTGTRALLRALVERIYRAMPLSLAKRLKGAIFVATGPLFKRTLAHQRWRAELATRGGLPGDDAPRHAAPALSPPAPAADAADGALVPTNPLWIADGHREWEDYDVVRARIDEKVRTDRANVDAPKPLPMLDFSALAPMEAAARIRLPSPPAIPEVTILVPVYNHLTTTLECLASIAAHAEAAGPSFEVLVADDASTDDTAATLAAIPHLRVVRQPANLGFLRNCNAALAAVRGRRVLLLNNDVQVTAGWLSELVSCLGEGGDVGAVGPRIVYPSGWLQEAGTSLHRDGTAEMVGLNDLPDRPEYSYPRNVDYCSGACLLLWTGDFRALDGFDLRYAPAYCEDSDLCMRLRAQGKRIVYCAGATVVHHLSRTSDQLGNDYKLACIAANLDTFGQRWRTELDSLDDVRTIAFYLPQFHPIAENNVWWGEGFTEWTNVTKARPNYVGHYQPRVPSDLGYYDLRLTEVLEQQAALARRYGIGGFCFYYYWFAGKRLLERPIEQMLETGRPDFPFCLCWANENWTRRWDGQEQDVLMAQQHSEEDDLAVIHDLMRYFRSPSYIRIDGKPLLLVYRVTLFPDFARTAARWREACRAAGIGEVYIAQVESFELVSAGIRPSDMGCDAAVEFPPQGMAEPRPVTSPLLNPEFDGAVADYRDLAVRYATRELPAYTRFMGVMPGWDNTARRQNNSYCFDNATPGAFQAWLETTIARTKRHYSGDERLVFVNAWNEWAEGAYLEPDRRFGHAFLQAHANAREAGFLVRRGGYALG